MFLLYNKDIKGIVLIAASPKMDLLVLIWTFCVPNMDLFLNHEITEILEKLMSGKLFSRQKKLVKILADYFLS